MENVKRYAQLIPKLKFIKDDLAINQFSIKDCCICLEPFTEGATIRRLPLCKHIFHDECLIKWLNSPA